MTPSFKPEIFTSLKNTQQFAKQHSSTKKKRAVIYKSVSDIEPEIKTGRSSPVVKNMYEYFVSKKSGKKSTEKRKELSSESPKQIGYLLGKKVKTKKFEFEPEEIELEKTPLQE